MQIAVPGLEWRDGMWKFRKAIPASLREAFEGRYNLIISLATKDRNVALRRYEAVKAEVEKRFKEASGQSTITPAVAAYQAVQDWRVEQTQRPSTPEAEEALDHYLSTILERGELRGKPLDARTVAVFEALLQRSSPESQADNPPVTVLFERYYAERKLPPRTQREWEGICARFVAHLGAALPVRRLTQAHLREFKRTLLESTSRRTGSAMAPATARKVLAALRAVLTWGTSEGYLSTNPAVGITVKVQEDEDTKRRPYSPEDLAVLFSDTACAMRRKRQGQGGEPERPADTWLPWLDLYTACRLEELGQLHVSDVRQEEEEEGVWFLAIEPGNGKKVKTRSSRREASCGT